jgi:CHAD domain-containing protein
VSLAAPDPPDPPSEGLDLVADPAERPLPEVVDDGDTLPASTEGAGDGERDTVVAPVELAVGTADRLAVGRSADVRAEDPWAEAGRKVLRFQLARMLGRTAGAVAGDDPEDVHAMRVASRRMRAAWRVFGDAFEADVSKRYRRDLRAVGGRLGAVRDLDVLIEILRVYAERRSEREQARLGPLLGAWQAERTIRRTALVEHLESSAFADFVAEYGLLVETEGLGACPVPPHAKDRVRQRMPATVWAAYGDVWAFDGDVAGADVVVLHELRIAAKWLRYTLEFGREALEPESTWLIGRVVALQDHLGVLHDMHVAAVLARGTADALPALAANERAATERFVKHLDKGVERLRDQRALGSTWKPVVATSYRRGLGRAFARL